MMATTDGFARAALPPRAWLAQLNDLVGAASRRLFQSQLVLRAASERDIRAQLPELCDLASALCRAGAASSAHRRAIRAAFSDPQAQWLSRGAVESGASGFFCHLLLRETAAIDGAHAEQATGASRLVVQLLLDPVLKNCYERAVESGHAGGHRACEWRFEKPKYYAMACAGLWETLLPFLARAARQHAAVFGDVLNQMLQKRAAAPNPRVNCRFAQVAGFWRLLEAVGDAKTLDHSPEVRELLPKMLAFVVRWSVLCPEDDSVVHEDSDTRDMLSDPHARFFDLVLEKLCQDMQEFLFKCAHATHVTRVALRSILQLHLGARTASSAVERVRFTAFVAATCLLVKGLAADASEVIKHHSSVALSNPGDEPSLMIVGMVSHIELIEVSTVLSVLHELLERYQEMANSPRTRREILVWVIYTVVCRQHALDATANQQVASFARLQERICAVDFEDLQLMPLHWMKVVWKVCIGMHADEVTAFVEEAKAFRLASIKLEAEHSPVVWEKMIQRVPSRRLDQYQAVLALLGQPYAESLKKTDLSPVQVGDEVVEKLAHQITKKRRRLRREVVVLSEEHEQSRQNALLLPEVMERISSFMSAKRLCRLSLVCRAFAGVTRSERLWKPLYFQLTEPLHVKCRHGVAYEHNWRSMYQAKYSAIKKLRSRQLTAARKAERAGDFAFCWHEDDHELRMSVSISSAQLCQECSCNQMFATNEAAKAHRLQHQKYRCPHTECREALTSAAALKQHGNEVHPSEAVKKEVTRANKRPAKRDTNEDSSTQQSATSLKSEFKCTVDGCNRSYKSQKWLQNHVERAHRENVIPDATIEE